jgi:type IV pilus assembly protein PilY1
MQLHKIVLTTGLAMAALIPGRMSAAPAQVPIFLVSGVESQVMINMSNDHQLFYKAYDDWSDLNDDGDLDTTYDHAIDYYGYFDAYKCYDYDAGAQRFEPQAVTANKYCDAVSGSWSGNFLNWASMTRIDTVRKVLYGGLRSTDTAAQTVLERAYLPGDAHSFAKYYRETVSGQMGRLTPWNEDEITICNTTYAANGDSEDRTEPPLLRIAEGNYALWAANERFQCHWDGRSPSELQSDIFNSPAGTSNNGNHPPTTGLDADKDNPRWNRRLGVGDFVARVEVCVSGLIGTEKCKVYPSLNSKPIGLLQEYGDDGDIHFGLLTGSYRKNKSGGTLRKNIGPIDDEINVTTDGTFKSPPGAGNIIGNLSVLRVSGYDHDPGYYNSSDNCAWGKSSFNNGECTNWGNPQSEIYLESLRYLAGENEDFDADDSSFINGLISASSWNDPLDNTNYCAPVKIIQFNASVTSYDNDELGGASDLASMGSLSTWTNQVGSGEGIAGNDFFVGTGTAVSNGICTAKTLANLADAEGMCPEAPRLEGGYDIAGLAYYAHNTSIRNDLTDADGNTAEIKVETYGVTLSPAVPKIEVPVPGSDDVVTILPACRNESIGGNCAIVDFKVVQEHTESVSGVYVGRYYVNWEDSEQGGDYDQDMAGTLMYVLNTNADPHTIAVITNVFADSTPNRMGFGYIISGTTQDGFHTHSGINFFTAFTDPTGVLTCSNGGIDCETGEPATSVTYTLGTSSGSLLEDPLYYAAKWGGFREEASAAQRPPSTAAPNGIPDQDYEWKSTSTGLPTNYFFARNPGELSSQLATVFDTIATVSSSASVVANSVSLQTTTRIYQARFDSADWSGKLLSFPVNLTTGFLEPAEWDAGTVIATQDYDSDRVWLTWDDAAGAGVPFRWSDIDAAQQALLDVDPDTGTPNDGLGDERLDYLRGDTSNELANGGSFRNRASPLGDVVHSTPTIVGGPSFGYRDYEPGTGALFEIRKYSEFKVEYGDAECFRADGTPITSWSAGSSGSPGGREPMVYFGGNDGALHGVSACTGHERLAFVPNAVYSDLNELTSTNYAHQFYVDGAPTVVDAFWGNAWHTVLVGSLEAGGKAVFALDVTDPNDFYEGNAGNVVLWEKDSNDTGYSELGYTYSQPAVIKAKGHGWVTVFGNGYDGASGKAVLYVARINDGALLATIDLSVVNASAHGSGNGLSTVSPIDTDGDGLVDLIYGGDRNGNVWRFAATTSGFATGSTSLLYSAKSATGVAQPITSRLAVGYHPTSGIGRIVYFGTGKYYELADQDPANAVQYNTMYGIWDRDNPGLTVNTVTTRDSSILQQQTITTQTVDTFGSNSYEIRIVSNTQVDWAAPTAVCSATASCGWYLDLTDSGEKMVSNPILRGGRLIFVTTIPSLVPCESGGSGWLMEIDPNTGGRMDIPVFDLNGDGLFDYNDNVSSGSGASTVYTPVSGKKSKVGILQPPAILGGIGGSGDGSYGGVEGKYSSGSKDGQIDVTIENPGLGGAGRKSWVRIQ